MAFCFAHLLYPPDVAVLDSSSLGISFSFVDNSNLYLILIFIQWLKFLVLSLISLFNVFLSTFMRLPCSFLPRDMKKILLIFPVILINCQLWSVLLFSKVDMCLFCIVDFHIFKLIMCLFKIWIWLKKENLITCLFNRNYIIFNSKLY